MEKSLVQKIILGAVFGILIGFGGAWAYFSNKIPSFGGNKDDITEDVATTTDETLVDDDASSTGKMPSSYSDFPERLSVKSQAGGSSVTIDKAVFDTLGWVVVYEDVDGEPGNILGASLFRKEMGQSGKVELLRDTEAFKKYYVVLHQDDGDGEFDYSKDIVMRDETTGKLIMGYFYSY